ncbi:hypothetical protein VIN01S_18270 [Vibrio inusitatus NBRC 102082]|uniref:OmpR/PhoB-type domain-containing protein n=1 Tax=Vibrio inusitatus NBRC 102082 TaxID=1219070 RepID=A0A4Y3HV12_9VIBR|nr:winged helix-turn-helix domain-containing protein [Vibrio inusitatus]GEA51023.1 hypothetical protein VIN01S_18270 [Vibrio inusitatus NBRC 102082]
MTEPSLEPPVYKIGELRFSPLSGVLELSGEKVVLRAREANLLNALIQSFPEVLSRTEIEAQLWKDSYATNATINQTIKSLRFSLKDEERIIIRTIPKQGYLLSKKPAVEETSDHLQTKDAKVELQRPILNKTNRIYFYIATLGSICAFALGVLGIGNPPDTQISQKIDHAWYLMEEVPATLQSQVAAKYDSKQVVVMHSGMGYQVCQLDSEVLLCQKL